MVIIQPSYSFHVIGNANGILISDRKCTSICLPARLLVHMRGIREGNYALSELRKIAHDLLVPSNIASADNQNVSLSTCCFLVSHYFFNLRDSNSITTCRLWSLFSRILVLPPPQLQYVSKKCTQVVRHLGVLRTSGGRPYPVDQHSTADNTTAGTDIFRGCKLVKRKIRDYKKRS